VPHAALALSPDEDAGRIEVRDFPEKPRLTLVARDGDPAPALVVVVMTNAGPIVTTSLAALVEARFRAEGLSVELRVDRDAFHLRFSLDGPSIASTIFTSIASAFHRSVDPNASELAHVVARLDELRRHPLDAPELLPVTECTGQLGIASDSKLQPPSALELERYRRAYLTTGRTSIAAVGPAPFCAGLTQSFEQSTGWDPGPPAEDTKPIVDTLGVYSSAALVRGAARVTLAMRVSKSEPAVVAATRLAAVSSPLALRLRSLPHPFQLNAVTGAARLNGGCLAVTIETSEPLESSLVTAAAATATALTRQELRLELDAAQGARVATRQVLAAGDAREAGSRAAWWALAGSPSALPDRLATVMALAPATGTTEQPMLDEVRRDFGLSVERALAARDRPLETKAAMERGQGELWVLLASPCGASEEGERDAGSTALSTIAAASLAQHASDLTVEPWISAAGIGIIAHGARRGAEPPRELARRVGDAAARALLGTPIAQDAHLSARALALSRLELTGGQGSAAFEAFASAISPDRPSWVDPFGVWSRVAGSRLEAVRLHRQALASGPLRVAVLANIDSTQVASAFRAVERWLPPQPSRAVCPATARAAPRPGHYDVRLSAGFRGGQAAVGAAIDPRDRALAELTAALLGGSTGLARQAFAAVPIAAHVSARVVGGERAMALIVELRASEDALPSAVSEVKNALARLAREGPTEADFARAIATQANRARAVRQEPRARLIDLWTPATAPPPTVTLVALRHFLSSTLSDSSLVVVEALPP
jgi:hypothetical protein